MGAALWPSGERSIWCWSCRADRCVALRWEARPAEQAQGWTVERVPGLAEPADPDVLARAAVAGPADAAVPPRGGVARRDLGRVRAPGCLGGAGAAGGGGRGGRPGADGQREPA